MLLLGDVVSAQTVSVRGEVGAMPRMSTLEAAFCRSAPWRLVARRLVPWATQGVPLAGRVLEIGAGSGAMAQAILAAHPRLRLTTTDADPAMVRSAQRRLARSAAEVRQADATALPFAEESFDTVLSFLMLHHVIHWEQAVAEASRVLRPGGFFVGYDLLASRAAAWLHVADRSAHRLIEPAAFGPALQHAGLEPVRLQVSRGGRVLRFIAHKPGTVQAEPGADRGARRAGRGGPRVPGLISATSASGAAPAPPGLEPVPRREHRGADSPLPSTGCRIPGTSCPEGEVPEVRHVLRPAFP
ncbi:Methyltransferase domain-containing protein [Micrococcus terreus]|uniref:Methyltransferase domain-containing protein n=2 Tax=Micrococcus terreus TaxID=574650 RepID=A0A1I7MLK0_9MICC|nr:Methyltransferase domain-containing protein [Micrococcus terreus]